MADMNLPTQMVLFADRGETLRDLGSGFRGDRAKVDATEIVIVLLAIAAVVATFWLLARWASWREGRGTFHSPKKLFQRLAAAHRLSIRERHLLLRAARNVKSSLPACLFLRPDLFDVAAAHSQLSSKTKELAAIKRKLFNSRLTAA
jgi:hypothetical protein